MEVKSKKILIVDDSPVAREILAIHLKSIGQYEIIFAKNGQEALDLNDKALASSTPFDVIFLDWNMPILDGLSALKIMRANVKMNKCVIVMLTAESEPDNLKLAKNEKVDFLLNKPINLEKIKKFMMMVDTYVQKMDAQ